MYQLKITTVGSSTGVILPKHVLEKLRVGKGDMLCLTETPDGFMITPYDSQFAKQMEVATSERRSSHASRSLNLYQRPLLMTETNMVGYATLTHPTYSP